MRTCLLHKAVVHFVIKSIFRLDIFEGLYYNKIEEKFVFESKGRILMTIQQKNETLSKAKTELASQKGYERLAKLFDDGQYTEIDAFVRSADGYAEVAAAHGTIDGLGVYAFAQNTDASRGAMSRAQAAKIKKVYDLALKTGEPVVAMYDSAGGRLDQGTDLLAAYGDILKYSNALSGVVPQISVVLGKCCGTQALIAVCGDIVIMTEKAELSLNTSGGSASARENAEKGTAHITAADEDEAINKTRALVSILPSNNLSTACVAYDSISASGSVTADMTAAQAALAVADEGSLIELQKDFGKTVTTALATINGTTAGIAVLEGKTLDHKSCAKAARFIRLCDAFSMPIISFINAESFECIKGAAKLASAYAEATAPKITVITGDAFGAVYIAAAGTGASADMTFAWTGASVSALTPEAEAVIMLGDDLGGRLKGSKDPKKDREAVVSEFRKNELTAMKAAENGYVDDIIEPSETRERLVSAVEMLSNKRVSTLPKKHNNLYI